MPFTYCGETADLTDAEILALVRYLCSPDGYAGEGDITKLRLTAVCDLGAGHPSLHASFQAEGGPDSYEMITWFRWHGEMRDVMRTDNLDCEWRASPDDVGCLLFKDHPGPHCPGDDDTESPSWCRS